MKRIRDKALEKLSALTEVPLSELHKLHALGVFDSGAVFARLMAADFKRIRKCKRYTVRQIVTAIANEYQVAPSTVHNAIYEKKKREFICTKCGKVVKKVELNRNSGVCDDCVAKEIEV